MSTAVVRAFALALILLGGCAASPGSTEPGRAAGVRYAYVVLGEDGIAVARAITTAVECPTIELDGGTQTMSVRAPAGTMAQRPTASAPSATKPSAFPVLTCEFAVPAGVDRAAIDGHVLPLPRAQPRRIVVIGDTGCRIKAADNAFQACNDPAQWPFAGVADTAAASGPDVVIHVGDYHYRENACPPGNAGCAGSPWGYGWDAWEADFFAPAARLLAAAPWIVVRGNHESCARAGQGWWRFLDPRPLAAQSDCNDPANDGVGDYSEPYAVPLGTGVADAQFIVFDSSLVGVTPLPPTGTMYANYRRQLGQAFVLAERRPNTLFMNHHPILAFAPNPARPDAPYPGNAGLQSVLSTLQPTVLFPPNVQALLAGHVHLFEMVTFSTAQPPQFVSGNAGDVVDHELPLPLRAGATPAPGAVVDGIVATNRFGFMTMSRDGKRWTMTANDAHGTPMTICTLFDRRVTCDPASLPGRY